MEENGSTGLDEPVASDQESNTGSGDRKPKKDKNESFKSAIHKKKGASKGAKGRRPKKEDRAQPTDAEVARHVALKGFAKEATLIAKAMFDSATVDQDKDRTTAALDTSVLTPKQKEKLKGAIEKCNDEENGHVTVDKYAEDGLLRLTAKTKDNENEGIAMHNRRSWRASVQFKMDDMPNMGKVMSFHGFHRLTGNESKDKIARKQGHAFLLIVKLLAIGAEVALAKP